MPSVTTVAKESSLFETHLRAKNYANSTIGSYTSVVKNFLRHFKRTPKRISSDEITAWIADHAKGATKAQVRGALLNYYTHVVGQPRKFDRIPYPKQDKNLPKVISKEVVVSRINAIKNLKHRAIVSVLYGAGLRRDELLCLRITDIDKFRTTIHIHHGKGAKDRIVPVSDNLLKLLRDYYRVYRPSEYLFEGISGGKYSAQSVRNICKLHMKCNPHLLRHCHATHLVEAGVDVSEVSKRLGHSKLETTMVYNHIATTHNPITLLAA